MRTRKVLWPPKLCKGCILEKQALKRVSSIYYMCMYSTCMIYRFALSSGVEVYLQILPNPCASLLARKQRNTQLHSCIQGTRSTRFDSQSFCLEYRSWATSSSYGPRSSLNQRSHLRNVNKQTNPGLCNAIQLLFDFPWYAFAHQHFIQSKGKDYSKISA